MKNMFKVFILGLTLTAGMTNQADTAGITTRRKAAADMTNQAKAERRKTTALTAANIAMGAGVLVTACLLFAQDCSTQNQCPPHMKTYDGFPRCNRKDLILVEHCQAILNTLGQIIATIPALPAAAKMVRTAGKWLTDRIAIQITHKDPKKTDSYVPDEDEMV